MKKEWKGICQQSGGLSHQSIPAQYMLLKALDVKWHHVLFLHNCKSHHPWSDNMYIIRSIHYLVWTAIQGVCLNKHAGTFS